LSFAAFIDVHMRLDVDGRHKAGHDG